MTLFSLVSSFAMPNNIFLLKTVSFKCSHLQVVLAFLFFLFMHIITLWESCLEIHFSIWIELCHNKKFPSAPHSEPRWWCNKSWIVTCVCLLSDFWTFLLMRIVVFVKITWLINLRLTLHKKGRNPQWKTPFLCSVSLTNRYLNCYHNYHKLTSFKAHRILITKPWTTWTCGIHIK